MTVNLVTVTGTIENLVGGAPTSGKIWFRISQTDWNTDGDIFAPAVVEATADEGGAFTVNLQSTDDFEIGAFYTAFLRYRDPVSGAIRSHNLSQFALPSGGPYLLTDLLAVPIVEPVAADVLALCQAYAASADVDRIAAELAADVAEVYGPRTFDSLALLEADTVLTPANTPVGKTVSVRGVGDYVAVASGGDIDNAGTVELNVKESGPFYNAMAFGMLGDGSDCADAFERACTRIDTNGGGTLYFPSSVYAFGRSVFKPISISLLGASPLFTRGTTAVGIDDAGTVFKPIDGGTYVDNFVFYCNVDPDVPDTWVRWYTANGPSVKRITFDAFGIDDGFNGFKFGGTYVFEDLRSRGCGTLIEKPNLYTDGVIIRSIQSQQRRNETDYLIVLPGLGDKLQIIDVASGYTGNETGTTKGVYVEQCRGGLVQGIVNGHHEFVLCQGLPITGCHLETGSITLDRCDMPVFGNFLYRTSNGDGQIIVKGDASSRTMPVIRDNVFQTILGWEGGSVMTTETADIVFNDAFTAAMLSGNTRSHTVNGVLSRKANFGVKISLPTGGLDNLFNRYTAFLSTQEVTVTGVNGPVLHHMIPDHSLSFAGLSTIAASDVNSNDFSLGAGTYYYQAQIIIDPVRMIGRTVTNAERSVTVAATNQLPTFSLDFGSMLRRSNVCVRVYRGTASGAYTSYCDLQVIVAGQLVDDGATLSGQPWLARTSGAIDTLNNNGLSGNAELLGPNMRIETIAAVPSVGTWTAGDEVRKTNVSTGQFAPALWRRLTSGTAWVDLTDYVLERVFVAGAAGSGATGTFTTVDGKTVTVTSGLVTSIV